MSREFSYMRFGRGKKRIELSLERKVRRSGFAGFVDSPMFQQSIAILVDDDRLDLMLIRGGYITACKDGTYPMIVLSGKVFANIKRGVPTARFMLFHEIGHYCWGHLNNPPAVEDEFMKRQQLVEQGIPSEEEVAADSFAAEYLGAEYALLALQDSMEERFALDVMSGAFNEDISAVALREYQLRIDALCSRFGIYSEESANECDI